MTEKTGKQYLQEIDSEINLLNKELGLNPQGNEVSKYLTMTEQEIRELNQERCAEIAVLLSGYSLYIKKYESSRTAIKTHNTIRLY